jgi:hypothetical protein
MRNAGFIGYVSGILHGQMLIINLGKQIFQEEMFSG